MILPTVPIEGDIQRAKFIDECYYNMVLATKSSPSGEKILRTVVPKQYNQIVTEYQDAWNVNPTRVFFETPTYMGSLGDLSTADVLELACGEGFFTRLIKTRTTGRVVGLDISDGMVLKARQQSSDIEYAVKDCEHLEYKEEFDVVGAPFLLCYANNYKTLLNMTNSLFRALKPGGRTIGLTQDPFFMPKDFELSHKYGVAYTMQGIPDGSDEIPKDGTLCTVKLTYGTISAEFDNYYMSAPTIEKAFAESGFKDFEWIRYKANETNLKAQEPFWEDFKNGVALICFRAYKPL